MARRIKQYRLRMTEDEFEQLEKLSRKLNMNKAKVIRHSLRASAMSLIWTEKHRQKINEAFNGGLTHAAVYTDTDSIKSTKEG